MGRVSTCQKHCKTIDLRGAQVNDLSLYVLYQRNHDIIYKMSNIIEIRFPIFLHFRLASMRLSNHIMTLTNIWNEAFVFISTPLFLTFFLTFWGIPKFPDTDQNLLTFSWLFKILTFSWLFPDLWEPWPINNEPVNALASIGDKPFSEPMMGFNDAFTCVSRPLLVKEEGAMKK